MNTKVLDKIISLLQSQDPEMVNLGKEMWIRSKPNYNDYRYISEAIALMDTSPEMFIDEMTFRLQHGYYVRDAGSSLTVSKSQITK